jgi:hypothetical protein
VSEDKVDKQDPASPVPAISPAQPAPEKPASALPKVPKEGLPTLVRPMSAEQVVSRLPKPPLPLPPPSEPKTLIKGEALKLPLPPPVASRPPPAAPSGQPVESQDPSQPLQPPPAVSTTSIPPPLPRTGFMTAVDSVRPLLDKTRTSLAPAIDAWHSLTAKAAAKLPAPAREWIRVRLDKLQAALPPGAQETLRRKPRLVPVVTIVALVVTLGLLGLVVSLVGRLFRGGAESASATSSSSAATLAASGGPRPASTSPCAVAGRMSVVAPGAVVAAGVEARPLGDAIALGFARSEHEAAAVRLGSDPAAVAASATGHSDDAIRRVRPVLAGKDGLALVAESDSPGDRVHGRRTLPLDPPLQMGASGSDLVWARPGGPAAGKLWSLDGSLEDLDALRAASETSGGVTTTAIAFRRGNSIWIGAAVGGDAPVAKGALSRIAGLGPTVGSPTVAIDDGVVMLAWADRPSPEVPWRLRMTHVKVGDAPTEATIFAPPAGGPGGHAMSPSLAALSGGRFLLVWTEGPVSQQRVRGMTLGLSGEPLGKVLEISVEGVNSGQGQAAVVASPQGKGVVAFLQASKDGFEVAVTPIACGL